MISCIHCGEKDEENPLEADLQTFVQQAGEKIAEAKALHDHLETYYKKAVDFRGVENTGNQIFNRILAIAAEKEKH